MDQRRGGGGQSDGGAGSAGSGWGGRVGAIGGMGGGGGGVQGALGACRGGGRGGRLLGGSGLGRLRRGSRPRGSGPAVGLLAGLEGLPAGRRHLGGGRGVLLLLGWRRWRGLGRLRPRRSGCSGAPSATKVAAIGAGVAADAVGAAVGQGRAVCRRLDLLRLDLVRGGSRAVRHFDSSPNGCLRVDSTCCTVAQLQPLLALNRSRSMDQPLGVQQPLLAGLECGL